MATIVSVAEVVVDVRRTDIVIPDPVVSARWNTNSSLGDLFPNVLGSMDEIPTSVYKDYRTKPFVIGWGSFHGRCGYDSSEYRDTIGIYWPEVSAPIYNDFIVNPIKDADWLVPALQRLCWDKDTRIVIGPAGFDTDGTPLYYIGHYEQPVIMIGGYYDFQKRCQWLDESKARHQKAYDDLINKYLWTKDCTLAEEYKRKALLHLNDLRLHR